jgi:hypothetical protein
VYSAIVRLLRLASILACMTVIVSFALFAINQTSRASAHQQQELAGGPAVAEGNPNPPAGSVAPPHKATLRRTIDEAAEGLTAPFAGLTSGSHSEWGSRSLELLLALVVYGFGMGFAARVLRVRL